MSKTISRSLVCFALFTLLVICLIGSAFAQSATPLAPGSIQVSRVQYDGNAGNNYVSPFGFPEIFNDQTGCNLLNDICNIAGIQGSIYIDQFSAVPLAPVAGSLSLPSTGAPAAYPTVEPGSYITTSFSSKSEGALMFSPGGNYLTYMGYEGGDQLDDVSNSYSPNPNYQLVPNTYTNGSGVPYPFYDREVALIGNNGLVSLTPIDNANSGDNPRAAITVDGLEFYTAGNSDSTEYTAHNGTVTGPGLTIGVRCGTPLSSQSYQLGTYVATDRPDETAKKHIKDNNWRGIGIYNDVNGNPQLYVSKGSGGNGDDGVFQVGTSLPTCSANGTDTNAVITPLFSAQATNPTNSNIVSQYTPFGFWFANPTTLYVADEGYQNLDGNGNLIPDPLAGLEKWSLVNGTWTLDYTIQAGLNLYQPQSPAGYVDQNGNQIQTFPTGLRNMTGAVNGDGTVTIYAITAQYSSVSSGEPDPTSLVGITDSLAATTLPANEQFVTLQTSASGEVFRGVAYIPQPNGTARQTQTISFTNPGPVAYGVAPITLAATATSNWPIAYTLISGPATLSGNVLTITGAGSVVVQADQSGNTEYSAAASVQDTIVVNPEATTVTWATPAPITYGTALSATQLNATASQAGSFVYTPPLGTVLGAGSQLLSVSFTPTNSNYAPSTGTVYLQVNQATPTITWSSPVAITYGTALSATQLNATASVPGTFLYSPAAGTVLGAGSQTLSVSFTPTDATDYTTAIASVALQVNQAATTVSWTTPAPITYGTLLSGTQLNATASVPGSFVYTPPAGTLLNAGNQTLSVSFTPTDNVDYAPSTGSVHLTVNKASQTISVTTPAPSSAIYGSQFTVVASAPGGPITYSNGGSCTNSGATYTMDSGIGECNVRLSQSGSTNYLAAPPVSEITLAGLATPTVSLTGAPAKAPFGSTFTLIATTNASTAAVITATDPATCSLSGSSSPDPVTILKGSGSCIFTATWAADNNYKAASTKVITTAEKAVPVITWPTPAPVPAGTALGSTQLDATANVAGSFSYSPAAGTVLTAGNQTLTTMFTPSDTADYSTASASVVLQVNGSMLSWAPPAPITYGTPLSGVQLNATASVPGTFVYTPGAGTVLGAGKQTLSVTFTPNSPNYPTATATVNLTVNKATPAITWPTPLAITYGQALSATQLDATANVPGNFTYSPAIGAIVNAGSRTLSVTFTPTDTTDYSTARGSVTLQVLQAPTATSITSSSSTVTLSPGGSANATLDFSVSSYKPTGAVVLTASTGEFCAGNVAPGTGLGHCTLTFTTTGQRTIVASYSGDTNHLASNSSGQTVTVTVNPAP